MIYMYASVANRAVIHAADRKMTDSFRLIIRWQQRAIPMMEFDIKWHQSDNALE